MWDCIVETWPIATGENVLGEALPVRRLHSPTTAAKEAGVTPRLIEQIMTNAGALPTEDRRPPALRTFDAARYGGLLAEIPSRVSPSEMPAAMGATEAQLRPLTGHPKVKALWRIADGLTLVAELDALARSVLAGDRTGRGSSSRKSAPACTWARCWMPSGGATRLGLCQQRRQETRRLVSGAAPGRACARILEPAPGDAAGRP